MFDHSCPNSFWNKTLDLLAGWGEYAKAQHERALSDTGSVDIKRYSKDYYLDIECRYGWTVCSILTYKKYFLPPPEHEHDYQYYLKVIKSYYRVDAVTGWLAYLDKLGIDCNSEYYQGVAKLLADHHSGKVLLWTLHPQP